MLLQMRTFTRSWIAYLLLFVLTIAFAIWGIKDVFNNVGVQNLAEVGGHAITPAELSRELDLTLRQQRESGESNLTQDEAVAQGLHTRLLEQMISREAFYAYAERMGVNASDAQVADNIRSLPQVLNPVTRAFDQNQYLAFLGQLRYSQSAFEQEIREGLSRQMLAEALLAGVRAPASYGDLLYAYRTETRVVSIAEAPAAAVGNVPPPTAAQLQSFYEDSQEALRLPEFRHLQLVYARPADFTARVNITDAQIQQEFDARRASLTQPEKRSYTRIIAQNEAQANDIAARLNRGEAADAIGAALHVQAAAGHDEARTDVPDAGVAAAVFSMAPHAPARVVRGSLTPFVVVRVESVTPAVEPNLAAMRDQIRTSLATDQAGELSDAAVSRFEELRSAGTSAAQAAQQAGLTVVDIPAAEAQGRDQRGQPIAALTDQREILQTAFQTAEGESSDFIHTQDADVVVAVAGVMPAHVQPLAEVHDQLTQTWMARERARRLREMAEQTVAAVHGGQSFAAAARAHHFNIVVPSRPISREQAQNIPARGLPAQIFAGQEGDVVSDLRADGGAVLVAVVEHINRADPAANPQQVEQMRLQMQQSLGSSLGEALQDQVLANAHPRRNDALLNQYFRRNAENQDNQ